MTGKSRIQSLRTVLKKRWRLWLRALHRDIGYLAIGLTLIYACSGIAINHVGEWDPNFRSVVEHVQTEGPLPSDEQALTQKLVDSLGVDPDQVRAAFFDDDTTFEVSLVEGVARLDIDSGTITIMRKEPRFLLRIANWLHYNRGKSAWTYIADGYAVFLLYLAISGMFMLKGRKGIFGRGGLLIVIGVVIPIIYVQFASGP